MSSWKAEESSLTDQMTGPRVDSDQTITLSFLPALTRYLPFFDQARAEIGYSFIIVSSVGRLG